MHDIVIKSVFTKKLCYISFIYYHTMKAFTFHKRSEPFIGKYRKIRSLSDGQTYNVCTLFIGAFGMINDCCQR